VAVEKKGSTGVRRDLAEMENSENKILKKGVRKDLAEVKSGVGIIKKTTTTQHNPSTPLRENPPK